MSYGRANRTTYGNAEISNHAPGAEWYLARCGPAPTITDKCPVTCKRCLASLAKRDREFQRKARRGIKAGTLALCVQGRAFVLYGMPGEDHAARAIAREEGRAL